MTITLQLSPEAGRALHECAARSDCTAAALAGDLPERVLANRPTFDEIFAPLRAEVAASGVSDEELDTLFGTARDEVWRNGRNDAASHL